MCRSAVENSSDCVCVVSCYERRADFVGLGVAMTSAIHNLRHNPCANWFRNGRVLPPTISAEHGGTIHLVGGSAEAA